MIKEKIKIAVMFSLIFIMLPAAHGDYSVAPDLTITGEDVSYFGASTSAGDFNGDGIMDIIAGAETAHTTGLPNSGGAYVLYGSKDNLEFEKSTDGVTIYGERSLDSILDKFGISVASGDINGDGIDDLLVGAVQASTPRTSSPFAGAVHIIYGAQHSKGNVIDLSQTNADVTIRGSGSPEGFGRSIAVGDVNGDHIGDIIVGIVRHATARTSVIGRFYVFYGKDMPSGTVIDLSDGAKPDVMIIGATGNERLGYTVASADINHDKFDDIIVGANLGRNLQGINSGIVYVVFGRQFGENELIELSSADSSLKIYGRSSGDNLGMSVAAGNVNNDNNADIIIGASRATFNQDRPVSGAVYVFYGSDLNNGKIELATQPANLTIVGSEIGSNFGTSVATGYVDNDKNADVIIGSGGSGKSNKAYVVFGDNFKEPVVMDLAVGQDVVINSPQEARAFGQSISSGDIDDDGLDDILIGAPLTDSNGTVSNGAMYIVYGKNFATFNPAGRALPAQAQKPNPFNTFSQFFDNLLSGFFVLIFKR